MPVPEGVSPEKHKRCVEEVKAKQGDKVNPYAVCTASMKKEEEKEVLKVDKNGQWSIEKCINRKADG